MNYKYILTAILIVAAFSGTASAAWANTSYTYAKNIALHGADTQLSNYPYLVSVAKEPGMQADYDDLIFYDQPVSQDGNLIDFEIETYNATTATVWLNITTLPTAGKTISMYYGNPGASSTQNPTAVWDSDYVGVWHLQNLSVPVGDDIVLYNANNPTIDESFVVCEQSVFKDDATGEYFGWIRGNDFYVYYMNCTDGESWVLYNTSIVGFGPYAFRDGDCWYLIADEDGGSGRLLYNVTEDHLNLVIMNGGNPVFDAIGIKPGRTLYNPSVEAVNGIWHMVYEMGPMPYSNGYTYTTPTELNFSLHTNTTEIIPGGEGGTADLTYVPERNALMTIHSINTNPMHIGAYYASLDDDLYDPSSWHLASNFSIVDPAVHLSDPDAMWNFNETYPCMISYNYDQDSTYQTYSTLSKLEFYDALVAGNYIAMVSDSTSNHNDGSLTIASGTTNVSGIIGTAIDFDNTHIVINTSDFYNEGTVSLWERTNTQAAASYNAFGATDNIADGEHYMDFYTQLSTSGDHYIWQWTDVTAPYAKLRTTGIPILENEYHHVAWRSNGTKNTLLLNGTETPLDIDTGSNEGNWFADDTNFIQYCIGARVRGSQIQMPFMGIIDEVRLSKTERSDDWINLSHQMVMDPSYVTFGTEETGGGGCGAYNITLPLGWSIIGWTNPTASTAHSMGTLIGGNCQYVTERNSTTGQYVTHVMSNPTDDNFAIERGWGYFVKTTAETLWERDS